MKQLILAIAWLAIVSLAACAISPTQTTTGNTTTVSLVARTIATTTPTQTTTSDATEEVEIRDLVGDFGKQLQTVSLLASDAAQEIKDQYSEFASPALLEEWSNDVSKAPGRVVSSPWPDRIEITALTKEESNRYVVNGFVIGVTSVEVVNGGAATKTPVRIVAQRVQEHWRITEYAEER